MRIRLVSLFCCSHPGSTCAVLTLVGVGITEIAPLVAAGRQMSLIDKVALGGIASHPGHLRTALAACCLGSRER